MADLGLTIKIGLDKESLKKANQKIGGFLKTGLKAGAIGAGAALATVGVAAAAAAAETIAFADDANAAMEQFRRETGLAEGNVQQFSNSAKNLFAAGVGEGIGDIAEAMATVSNTMQTGAGETEKLTKRALTMRDVFDKDVGESIDAVKVLMDEFGLTSDEAFDFLVAGAQKGLDRNDDLLDSVREYGNLFGDAGFDASQFFSILESGAEGGVLGTDKIADAVKEMGIRLNEGGDAASAFETITGSSFERVSGFVRGGDEAWADYFSDIISGLQDIEDPLERNRLQVALFGTQAEDLGVSFTEGLSDSTTSLEDMSGAMDEVITKNQTIGESMSTLHRQMVVALEPVAQDLMPFFAEGISKVSEFLMASQPIIANWASNLDGTLGPALTSIGESLVRIGVAFGLIPENVDSAGSSLDILISVLDGVNAGITGVAEAIEFLASAMEKAVPLWEKIKEISGFSSELTDISEAPFEVKEGSLADIVARSGLFGREGKLNVLGFAGGGSFTVGGSGGTDSQPVGFMGTPGERVEITQPGQMGAGGLTININSPVFGVDDLDAKLNTWGQEIIDATAGAMN
jgi:phage-related minor tail protein